MRILIALVLALGGCGVDTCRPIPTCQSLGWNGTDPLLCSRTAGCAFAGVRCVTDDRIVCKAEDEE